MFELLFGHQEVISHGLYQLIISMDYHTQVDALLYSVPESTMHLIHTYCHNWIINPGHGIQIPPP
jgi:hypothetical protein